VEVRDIRGKNHRAANELFGRGVVPALMGNQAQEMQNNGVARALRENITVDLFRLGKTAGLMQLDCATEPGIGGGVHRGNRPSIVPR
jgi:hypothetical protein